MTDIFLSRANLCRANLIEADLRGANLIEANLREANLIDADLREANLRGANLRGANLIEADLRGADLRGADLRGADLRGANLIGADLRGADLIEANLRGASGIKRYIFDPRGWVLVAWKLNGRPWFNAGCRSFSHEDAVAHWGGDEYPDKNRGEMYLKAIEFSLSIDTPPPGAYETDRPKEFSINE